MSQPLTILGIDPGTREMGCAVLNGSHLVGYGVHTLRNGRRPHDVIGQARKIVLSYITEHSPQLVGIEKPLLVPTKRAALVSVIAQELHARSRELGLRVLEISPRRARALAVGSPHATKLEVARVLVGRFPDLRALLPKRPKRSALGYRPRDKYWLHMFDALALAVALEGLALRSRRSTQDSQYPSSPRRGEAIRNQEVLNQPIHVDRCVFETSEPATRTLAA